MELQGYIDEIKLSLTGAGVLNLELNDEQLTRIVNSCFQEVQRYINTTKLITIPFNYCIDLTPYKVSAVTGVYRVRGYLANGSINDANLYTDPLYASQWQILYGSGNIYGLQDWVYNYGAWNTLMQIRNTISTDLMFKFNKPTNKLYINCASDKPEYITIEYIPIFENVNEITSDFWIDILKRLCVAKAKVIVGRIRSRYTQNNAMWSQDGDTLLEEGNSEIDDLREKLRTSSELFYPVD